MSDPSVAKTLATFASRKWGLGGSAEKKEEMHAGAPNRPIRKTSGRVWASGSIGDHKDILGVIYEVLFEDLRYGQPIHGLGHFARLNRMSNGLAKGALAREKERLIDAEARRRQEEVDDDERKWFPNLTGEIDESDSSDDDESLSSR